MTTTSDQPLDQADHLGADVGDAIGIAAVGIAVAPAPALAELTPQLLHGGEVGGIFDSHQHVTRAHEVAVVDQDLGQHAVTGRPDGHRAGRGGDGLGRLLVQGGAPGFEKGGQFHDADSGHQAGGEMGERP